MRGPNLHQKEEFIVNAEVWKSRGSFEAGYRLCCHHGNGPQVDAFFATELTKDEFSRQVTLMSASPIARDESDIFCKTSSTISALAQN